MADNKNSIIDALKDIQNRSKSLEENTVFEYFKQETERAAENVRKNSDKEVKELKRYLADIKSMDMSGFDTASMKQIEFLIRDVEKKLNNISADIKTGTKAARKEILDEAKKLYENILPDDVFENRQQDFIDKIQEAIGSGNIKLAKDLMGEYQTFMSGQEEAVREFVRYIEKNNAKMLANDIQVHKDLIKISQDSYKKREQFMNQYIQSIERSMDRMLDHTMQKTEGVISRLRSFMTEFNLNRLTDDIMEGDESFVKTYRKIRQEYGLTVEEKDALLENARRTAAMTKHQKSANEIVESTYKIMQAGVANKEMAERYAMQATLVETATGIHIDEMGDLLEISRDLNDEAGQTIKNIGETVGALKRAGQLGNMSAKDAGDAIAEAAHGLGILANGDMNKFNQMTSGIAAAATSFKAQGIDGKAIARVFGDIASGDVSKISQYGLANSVEIQKALNSGDIAKASAALAHGLSEAAEMGRIAPELLSQLGLDEKAVMRLRKFDEQRLNKDVAERLKTLETKEGAIEETIENENIEGYLVQLKNSILDSSPVMWLRTAFDDISLRDIWIVLSAIDAVVTYMAARSSTDKIVDAIGQGFAGKGVARGIATSFKKGFSFSKTFHQFAKGKTFTDGFSRAFRYMKLNFSKTFLKPISKYMTKITAAFGPKLTGLFSNLWANFFKTGKSMMKSFFSASTFSEGFSKLGRYFTVLGRKYIFHPIYMGLSKIFGNLLGIAKGFGSKIFGFVEGLMTRGSSFLQWIAKLGPVGKSVADAIGWFTAKIGTWGKGFTGFISSFGKVGGFLTEISGTLGGAFSSVVGILGKAGGFLSKILSKFGAWLGFVFDAGEGFFNSEENVGSTSLGARISSGIGNMLTGSNDTGGLISNIMKYGAAGAGAGALAGGVGAIPGAIVGGLTGAVINLTASDNLGSNIYHYASFESAEDEEKRLAKRDQVRAASHAGGLSEVPYDNYPAFLHKGEAVLTADQAGVVRHALPSDGGLPSISAFFDSINPFAMRTAEAASHTGSLLARIAENTGDLKAIQEEYNEDSLELLEKGKTFGEGGENSLSALDKQNMKMEKKAQERQQKSFFDKLKEGFQKGGVPGALGAIGEQAANLGRDIYNRAFGGGAAGKDVSALPGGQIAMAISGKTGLPAELIWAQLYHETGGFDSELATKYHNYGGVKGAGNEIGSDERGHSYFASDQDFIDYYSNYILKYAEDGIGIKNAKTAAQWASVLKAGGYYTDDEANYAASMQGILDAHASQMKELQSGGVLSKVAGTFQMAAQTLSNNCTVTAINAIEKFYTGVASAAEDGFSTAWGTLEGKLNATEYDFDVNEFPEFDKTLRNLLAGGQERPMAFYMTGGAGDEGNHILNAHSGNHMVVITRMMPDGTFEVQDPQDGSTQYLRSDQIFDATARGGTQGMGAGEGNALFVPNIYTAAMGEWEVQNDGDMYKLHAGEMVLPPETAESMRAMLQGGANAPIQPIPDIESIKESLREANPNMSEAQINAMARRTAQVNAYRQELTNGVPLHEGVNRVSGTVGGSGLQQDQLDALKKVADEAKARGESIDVREAFRRANQSVDMTDRTLNAEDREKLDAIREFRQNNPFKQAAENKQELTEAVAKGCQEGCQQGVEEGLPETKPEIAPTKNEIPTVPTKPEIAPTKNEIPTVPTRPPMATAGGGFGGGLAQNRNLPSNDILQRLMNPNGGFMGRGGAGSIMDLLRTPGIFGGGQSPLRNLPFNTSGGLPGIIGTIFGRTGIGGTRWGGALQSVLQNIFGGGNVQSMITGVLGNFNTGRYSNLIGTGINALGSLIGGYFERGRKKKEAILATAQKDQFGNITNLKDMPNELRITEKDSKEIAADKFKKQQELYYAQEKALQKAAQAKADADKKNAESNANITEATDKEKQLAQAAITESKQEAKEIARPVTEPSAVAENAAMAEQKAAAATQQTTAAQTRTNLNTVSPPSPAVQQVEAQTELGTGASVVDAIKWAVGRMEAKSDQIITAIGANGGGTTNNMFNQEQNPGYDMMRVLGTAFRF